MVVFSCWATEAGPSTHTQPQLAVRYTVKWRKWWTTGIQVEVLVGLSKAKDGVGHFPNGCP